MQDEFILGADGHYYNKFGSVVYPRRKNRNKIKLTHLSLYQPQTYKNSHSYKEFEIQAVAYVKLRDFFKDDKFIRGEFAINDGVGRYIRCDLAILDKNSQLILIIEVKRNLDLSNREVDIEQIKCYEKYAPVFILHTMQDAENIVTILLSKGYLNSEKFGWNNI
jgi:hypothetical protein